MFNKNNPNFDDTCFSTFSWTTFNVVISHLQQRENSEMWTS
jgi:hypothetical protein